MGRSLGLLKVTQLREELEKRGLEKTGVKSVLLQRLQKSIESDGMTVDEFVANYEGLPSFNEADGTHVESESYACVKDAQDSKSELDICAEKSKDNESVDLTSPSDANSETNAPDIIDLNDEKSAFTIPHEAALTSTEADDENELRDSNDENSNDVLLNSELRQEEPVKEDLNELEELSASHKVVDALPQSIPQKETQTPEFSSHVHAEGSFNSAVDAVQKTVSRNESSPKKIPRNDPRSLFVGNLSRDVKAVDLKNLFQNHGQVVVAKIVSLMSEKSCRWLGYLQMLSDDDAKACIEKLDGTELLGRNIIVSSNINNMKSRLAELLVKTAPAHAATAVNGNIDPLKTIKQISPPKEDKKATSGSVSGKLTLTESAEQKSDARVSLEEREARLRKREMRLELEKRELERTKRKLKRSRMEQDADRPPTTLIVSRRVEEQPVLNKSMMKTQDRLSDRRYPMHPNVPLRPPKRDERRRSPLPPSPRSFMGSRKYSGRSYDVIAPPAVKKPNVGDYERRRNFGKERVRDYGHQGREIIPERGTRRSSERYRNEDPYESRFQKGRVDYSRMKYFINDDLGMVRSQREERFQRLPELRKPNTYRDPHEPPRHSRRGADQDTLIPYDNRRALADPYRGKQETMYRRGDRGYRH